MLNISKSSSNLFPHFPKENTEMSGNICPPREKVEGNTAKTQLPYSQMGDAPHYR